MSVKEMLHQEIDNIPDEILIQVYHFIQFLVYKQENEKLTKIAQNISEKAFEKVWDNEEDAVYDNLALKDLLELR